MFAHRRNFILKIILGLVVTILVVQLLKYGASSDLVRELQQSGRGLAAIGEQQQVAYQDTNSLDSQPHPEEVLLKTQPPPTVPPTEPPSVFDRVKQVRKKELG